jgi:hypothetical protein
LNKIISFSGESVIFLIGKGELYEMGVFEAVAVCAGDVCPLAYCGLLG